VTVAKLTFRPGINKEVTRYAGEGGFYDCNFVRFRTGYPEKLGGWTNYSPTSSVPNYMPSTILNTPCNTFLGVARTMFNWVTYQSENLVGLGTNQLYYIENGGYFYNITPVRQTTTPTNPFSVVATYSTVTVTDPNHGASMGSIINISGGASFAGGILLSGYYEILQVLTTNTYVIGLGSVAGTTGSGGGTPTIIYKINAGSATYTQSNGGWGSMPWGEGGWGGVGGIIPGIQLTLWSEVNFNQDLVMAQYQGGLYYWTKDTINYTPAVTMQTYANSQVKYSAPLIQSFTAGANSIVIQNSLEVDIGAIVTGTGIAAGTYVTSVPLALVNGYQINLSLPTTGNSDANNYSFSYAGMTAPQQVNQVIGSSTYGFIVTFGGTPYQPVLNSNNTINPVATEGVSAIPLLVRWSDQSNAAEWTPTTYNQAGSQTLSNGSYIVGAVNTRQEILIWTDSSLYSMQYIGPPFIFGFTSMMDNISCISPNCMVTANGITYWMGTDKFYVYSGTVSTLPSTLRKYIFSNINLSQAFQIVCGSNERFNEIWWFYPSLNSTVNDSYVIYNYLENTWYNGMLNRSGWYDSPLRSFPMALFSIQTSYLDSAIGLTDTTLTLLNGVSYPITGTLTIDSEQITYTGRSGSTFTGLTRGVNGTTPAAHSQYAAAVYLIPNQILFHEDGVDDNSYPPMIGAQPIYSYLQSSDFDLTDGDHYVYVSRLLPDFAFAGSTAASPQILLTVLPRQDAGSAYQTGVDQPTVTSTNTYPVEEFTGAVYTRVRGRQAAFRIDSPNLGVFWQMGAMRFDARTDGKR
jgi:hypothetical protein